LLLTLFVLRVAGQLLIAVGFGDSFHRGTNGFRGSYRIPSSRGAEDESPEPETLERGVNGFPVIDADDRAVGDIGFFDDWPIRWKYSDPSRRIIGSTSVSTGH
jgi:hypothetical protein